MVEERYGECSVCKLLLGTPWSTFAQESNLGSCRTFCIMDFKMQVETRQATGAHLLCCPKESSPAFLLHDFLGTRVPGGVHLYLLGIWVSPGSSMSDLPASVLRSFPLAHTTSDGPERLNDLLMMSLALSLKPVISNKCSNTA